MDDERKNQIFKNWRKKCKNTGIRITPFLKQGVNMKKFYWLKLKDDFFKQKAIKKLRKIAGGDTFTIIYLKMLLIAMKNEGKIFFEGIEDNIFNELSLELDEDSENVRLTMLYLINHGLMEEGNNEYFLPDSVANTGSETDSAERVRRFRERSNMLQCNDNVTLSNTEIEREKREKKKEKIKSKESENILLYLNNISGYNYRLTDNNLKMIDALIKKGFTENEIINVIDKKVAEWKGTEMEQYIRPITLFGNKFESYLNQPFVKKQNSFQKQKDKLNELYERFGGGEDEQAGNVKNIFGI
jgi:predicted phage replisome organizer/uncharacterized phage protein (TIGR02220 family)